MRSFFYLTSRTRAWRVAPPAPATRGLPLFGRIGKLFVGQGHGLIRLADHREVFFHRADVIKGESINDLAVGDAVAFELLDDLVSGPRALHVARQHVR